MFGKLRIQTKLLLINVITMVTAFVFAGAFWLYRSHSEHEDFLSRRITSQAQFAATNISAAVMFEDWESAREILEPLRLDEAISAVYIFDTRNQIQVSVKRPIDGDRDSIRSLPRIHERPIKAAGETLGTLRVVYTDSELNSALWRYVSWLLLMATGGLILAAALTTLMQSSVIRPIRALSDLARRVTESKNYTLRAKRTHDDEVGELVDDFNAMLEIISRSSAALEHTAQDRALQIERTSRQLEIEVGERERSEQARLESQARFEQVFLNAPIGMALIDENHQILRRNQRFDRVLGSNDAGLSDLEVIFAGLSWQRYQKNFASLVAGALSSFEMDIDCTTRGDRRTSVVVNVSSIATEEGFRYAILQLQDVTEARRMSVELEHQATHDALTGLANRRALTRALHDVSQQEDLSCTHAFCVVDLDRFKLVNDSCGHSAGDLLLQQVATRLTDNIRSDDLAVRLGGDEFGLLLYDCNGKVAEKIAEKIRKSIGKIRFEWHGTVFSVTATIGIATFRPDFRNISSVLQVADNACLNAKDNGRNQVVSVSTREALNRQRQQPGHWLRRLNRALEHDHFELFHQPLIALKSPEAGLESEVLLRLRDERDGSLILPDAFFPTVVRYGLCQYVDRWVLETLIEKLTTTGAGEEQSSFWINLSAASLSDRSFLTRAENKIAKAGLPRGTINFEITEKSLIRNLDVSVNAIERLRVLGCKFALDDFGRGITSFEYLKGLPLDQIKVDGAFIQNIENDPVDRLFVKSIIDIAEVMGMTTVVECIESIEVRNLLAGMGADFGQGFALAKPRKLVINSNNAAAGSTDQHADAINQTVASVNGTKG